MTNFQYSRWTFTGGRERAEDGRRAKRRAMNVVRSSRGREEKPPFWVVKGEDSDVKCRDRAARVGGVVGVVVGGVLVVVVVVVVCCCCLEESFGLGCLGAALPLGGIVVLLVVVMGS